MKIKSRARNFVGALFFLIFLNVSSQEKYIHNRSENTFVEFSEIVDHLYSIDNKAGTNNLNVYSSTNGYLLLVNSLDSYRDISPEKMNSLDLIFSSIMPHVKVSDLFEKEVFVKTNKGNYWLPIQNSLFDYWIEEMSKDDYCLVYIRTIGSTNDIEENKWLFIINSFNSDYYDGLWQEAFNSFTTEGEENGFRCLKKLMSLDPKDGRNYSMYGNYYFNKADQDNIDYLKKADSLYTIASRLSPGYSFVYYQMARVNYELKNYYKAWEAVEKHKNLNGKRIDSFFIEQLEEKFPYSSYLAKLKTTSSNKH